MATIHRLDDHRPTQCGECGEPMRNWQALRAHFVLVHIFEGKPPPRQKDR